jgi:hypothetical protein
MVMRVIMNARFRTSFSSQKIIKLFLYSFELEQ